MGEDYSVDKEKAQSLLEEALGRFQDGVVGNARDKMSMGGIYWRLATVLRYYCEPNLEDCEGHEHAERVKSIHGVVRDYSAQNLQN